MDWLKTDPAKMIWNNLCEPPDGSILITFPFSFSWANQASVFCSDHQQEPSDEIRPSSKARRQQYSPWQSISCNNSQCAVCRDTKHLVRSWNERRWLKMTRPWATKSNYTKTVQTIRVYFLENGFSWCVFMSFVFLWGIGERERVALF